MLTNMLTNTHTHTDKTIHLRAKAAISAPVRQPPLPPTSSRSYVSNRLKSAGDGWYLIDFYFV